MDSAIQPIKFDIHQDGRLVRTEILTDRTIKIGKLSSSHLRIDDDDVSRMHAVVETVAGGQVFILDLGSASGTYVNGQRVTKHPLRTGDEITLGTWKVVVTMAGQPAATQVAEPSKRAPVAPRPLVARGPLYDEEEEAADGERALEVLVLWGSTVVDVRHFTEEAVYTIGQEPEVSQFVHSELLSEDPYPLARTDGRDMVINVPDGVSGDVMLDGTVYSLDDLKEAGKLSRSGDAQRSLAMRLPARGRCRLAMGDLVFLINSVPAATKILPPPLYKAFDGNSLRYLATSVLLHGLFFAIILSIPEDAGRLSLDSFDLSDRWVEFMLKPESEKQENLADLFKDLKEEAGEAAKKAKDKAGKMGKRDSTDKNKRFAVKGPKDNNAIQLARERRRQEAIQVADAAFSQLEGELSAAWGKGDRAIGSDAVSALGGMFGDSVGEAHGFGGLGVSGIGRGGGGFSESSIGVGSVGTRGRGGGGGTGYGRGVSRYGRRSNKVPKVIPGKPIVSGALDREIIRRIIRQHRAEYQYCYEKELNKKRDLNGKIKVKFTIAGSGTVIAAKVTESTMNNSNVERCLVKRIRRWVFPEPKGGGVVIVTYPFIFKPS